MAEDAIDIGVTIGGNLVSCATDISWDYVQNVENPDPCKGDAANQYIAPARSGKEVRGTLRGLIDYASTQGHQELKTAWLNNTDITIVIAGPDSGDDQDTIVAILTRVGGQAGSTGKGGYDADFVGDGTAPVVDTV